MRKALTILFFLSAACTCFAQTESLLIGPGDLVYVDVFDTPQLSQEVRVDDAGTVRLEFVGAVKVAGKTPADAAKIIETQLVDDQIMRKPQVTVKVAEYATQNVSVSGEVKNPGTYQITTSLPILRVLSMAGGLTEMADRNVTIQHRGDASRAQYYLSNNALQALSDPVLVEPGDLVVVPRAAVVYVLGDVARPGGYPITTNDSHLTVLQAIAMAGSANKTSVQSRVRLIRKTPQGQQEMAVRLAAIEKGKQPDLVLEPDDIIYVPFSWIKNVAVSASSIAASTSGAAVYTLH